MADWLPSGVVDEFGARVDTMVSYCVNGSPDDLGEVLDRLQGLGHKCRESERVVPLFSLD